MKELMNKHMNVQFEVYNWPIAPKALLGICILKRKIKFNVFLIASLFAKHPK